MIFDCVYLPVGILIRSKRISVCAIPPFVVTRSLWGAAQIWWYLERLYFLRNVHTVDFLDLKRLHTIEMWKSILKFRNELQILVSTHDDVPRGRHIFCLYRLVWREVTPEYKKKHFQGQIRTFLDHSDFQFFNEYW